MSKSRIYRTNIIVDAVCRHFGLDPYFYLARTRAQYVSIPRQLIGFLLMDMYVMSQADVARFLQQDRTTVCKNNQRIKGRVEVDERFRQEVLHLKSIIHESFSHAI